jgi:hypothetical protein
VSRASEADIPPTSTPAILTPAAIFAGEPANASPKRPPAAARPTAT